ncbi:hypothetical protein IWX90DRAFT_315611 [Phyllosticta citrichinensis]|uniref:Shelterin complex subunit TPP1/Est3 domain-containing protein n=1 Tax=Phyllosticta citrichinensis TaxID=1130410 RepID=A0ABR1XJ23_9PEZI
MVLFSDWLGPNVEDEIELGIAWRQENAESKSQIKHSQTLEQMYSNDGSNLRFTHEPDHDNTAVQIFKLLQDHGNSDQKFVDALASDTHTSIKIRFSSECIQSLRKQNERILDSLRGAIFFLKQFEIVVAYVGALGIDIVWLLVKEAQYHGQSGLGMLGKPKPIHKRPRIQHLLTRLNQDPADEDMESQCAGSPSRKTPLSDHNPEEEASAMTGTQFGTQVVTSAIRPRKNPAVGLSRDSHPGHGTAVPGKVDPVALLQQLGTTNDPRRQSGKPVETPKRNRTPAQAPAIAKKIKKEPTDPVPPREPEATDENDKVGSHSNIVKDGLIAPAAVPSVELPGGFRNTKENTPIASGPSPQYRMLDQPSNPVASFRESPPVDAARPPQSLPSMIETDDAPTSFQAPLPENHSSTQTTSSASANLAPHDGLDRILQTDDSQLVNPSLPSSTSGPAQSSGSNAQSANSKASKSIASAGPWKETLLISRAICRVPEDQEEILNKFESWLPPPSGRIFPVARLPESVLTSLSTRTEEATKARQKEQPSSSNPTAVEGSNSQTTSVSTTDDEDGDAENEDDPSNAEPASSAEIPWSLSPADHYGRLADYELPPNSSADQQSPKRATGRAPDFGDFPVDSSAEQQSNPRPPSSRIHKKTNVAGSGPPELMTTEVSQNQATSARPIENALDEESTDMCSSPLEPRQNSAAVNHTHDHDDDIDMEVTIRKSPSPSLRSVTSRLLKPAAVTPLEQDDVSRVEETPYMRKERPVSGTRSLGRNFMDNHQVSSSHPPPRSTLLQPSASTLPKMSSVSPLSSRAQSSSTRQNRVDRKVSASKMGFRFDGVAESHPNSSDNEDSMARRQLLNEMERQASHQSLKKDTRERSDNRRRTPSSDVELRTSSKRGRHSPSPKEPSSKKPKSLHTSYGFSQESPVTRDPKENGLNQKREFMKQQRKKLDAQDANTGLSAPPNQTANARASPSMSTEQMSDEGIVAELPEESLDIHSHTLTKTHDRLGNLAGSGAGTYSGKPTTTMIKQEGGLDAPSTPNQHQAFDLNLQSLPMQSTEAAHSEMSQSFDQTYLEDSDDVLAQFRAAYPEYNGDHEHFENLCHHLYCLSQSFPLSVWDDYVGRHKTEYIPYMGNCAHKGLDPLPYSEFYINKVDEVKHTKRILNKSSLAPIFERLNNQTSNRQARNRSRSPVSEQRRQSKALGVPSSAYRERSPVPTRSTSPTTTQPGSVAVRPWGTERSQRFPVAEKRQSRVSLGGHVSEYRERSPFGRPSIPISADYGSPNRRQSMPVRARDSGDNHRFRGESYRPPPRSEYDATLEQSLPARPSHALPDERQQQPQVHKRLPEELSPKVQRLPDPDPSPSGRSPSSASFQRVPAAQASSSSQHRPQPITTKLSAPGPSNPSVALDKTNAKPVPSASVGQSKAPTTTATRVERSSFDNSTLASGSNTPAGTLTKNLVRRGGGGGGGGRGRGRGGFNRPSHRGAAADASTIQTFSDASRASGTSPPKPPETTNPATPFVDLTSSPPKNPVGYGRSGGAERGRGSFASSRGGPGTGGDARRGGDDDRPRSAFGHKTADVQAAVNARVDATIAGLQQAKPTAKLTTTATPRVAATTSSSTPTITKSTNNNTPMAKTTTTSPAAVRSRYPAPPPPLKTAKTPSRAGSTASAASSPQQAGKATKRKKKKSSELPGMLKELKKTWKEQQRDNQSPDAGGGGRAPSRVS